MLGHLVGVYVEFRIIAACNRHDLRGNALCTAASVFAHECIVEPSINTVIKYGINVLFGNNAYYDASLPDWGEVLSSVFGALAIGQSTQRFISENEYITSAGSLVGSYIGGEAYEVGRQSYYKISLSTSEDGNLVESSSFTSSIHDEN